VATALDFLLQCVREYVNPTVPDDKPGAEYLADECMRDAKNAGVDEAALIAAARGDLAEYMLSRLNVAGRAHPRNKNRRVLVAGTIAGNEARGSFLNRPGRRKAAIRHRAGSDAIVEPHPVPLAVPNAGIPTVAPAEWKIIRWSIIIRSRRCADDSGAGCAVTSAAPAQTVMPAAMSDPARFRGLGCHSR
jgi:hypothetical protein